MMRTGSSSRSSPSTVAPREPLTSNTLSRCIPRACSSAVPSTPSIFILARMRADTAVGFERELARHLERKIDALVHDAAENDSRPLDARLNVSERRPLVRENIAVEQCREIGSGELDRSARDADAKRARVVEERNRLGANRDDLSSQVDARA